MKLKAKLFASLLLVSSVLSAQDFKLTESGYFKNAGVDVMAFDDIYPEGHQGGQRIQAFNGIRNLCGIGYEGQCNQLEHPAP